MSEESGELVEVKIILYLPKTSRLKDIAESMTNESWIKVLEVIDVVARSDTKRAGIGHVKKVRKIEPAKPENNELVHAQASQNMHQIVDLGEISKAAAERSMREWITEMKSELKIYMDFNKENSQKNNKLMDLFTHMVEDGRMASTELKTKVEAIAGMLGPVAKFYGGSAMEKGNLGEDMITRLISSHDRYSDAIIEDVSGTTASGDMLVKWRGLVLLIEVKNKKKLTAADMQKFGRDVDDMRTRARINGALMVSLGTDEFPGKSRDFPIIEQNNGVFVVYTCLKNEVDFHAAMSCLQKLAQVGEDTDAKEMESSGKSLLQFIRGEKALLEKKHRALTRDIKAVGKQIAEYDVVLEKHSEIFG